MAAPVNANINVFANTEQAMAQFRALQAQVAATNKSIGATSGAAVAQQAALNRALMDGANASKMWSARMVPMNTAVQQFSTALDKGKLSLGQYTRYAASQLPGMSRVFKREFEMMNRVATQNVRQMQTQYVTLGQSAQGAAQAMALTPTALNKHAAASAIATQRQMMLNRMIDLGTTKLLNYGKNTQWAGRQLMVGFSIPLAMVGAVAAKTFKEIDQGSIAFRRVYGDLSTTTAEMERNLQAVKDLGAEYTRYGLKLSDTIELAADVAATGAKNNDLLAATEQTLRLSTLGLMEYDEALEATIALQTAFGVSSEDLGSTIDFLNVVENETILTMQDMAAAIPRVAPVVKGLGGDVRDLAVLMTAMREGGVTAAEGANALKTGLGRLINPTKAARDVMDGFGISLSAMIQSNRGDLMGMINDFGAALATLDDFEQQQALEKVFGKRQYARLGALFKNIANDSSQAQRTVELTNMSLQELGEISERELGKIEEATSTKFAKAVEQLKVSIAPIGEQFMKALTPVIGFVTKIADKFNELPDSIKNAISIGIAAIAGVGPIVLMTIGLIANGIANIGKLIQTMRKFFARLKGNASAFEYLTQEEREATAAARGLSGATDNLTTKFLGQQRALERLISLTTRYAGALTGLSGTAAAVPAAVAAPAAAGAARPVMGNPVPPAYASMAFRYQPQRFATGGTVPGSGNKDTVPALLTPGETVVNKQASQKFRPIIDAMNAGSIKMLAQGSERMTLPRAAGGIPITFDARSAQRIENVLTRLNAWLAEGNALDQQQVAQLRQLIASDKVTGDALKNALRKVTGEQGRFSARGARTGEGAGKTSAPGWVSKQTKAFANDPRIQAERRMLLREFGPGGRNPLTSGQFRNISGLEASHIRRVAPGMDKWAGQAANLNPEFGAIQKYLERIRKSYGTWSQTSAVTDALSREFNGDMNIVRDQIDKLAQGVQPLDDHAHRAVRTFANLDTQLSRAAVAAGQTHTALGTVAKSAASTAAPAAFLANKRITGQSTYFSSGGGALRYAPASQAQAAAVTAGTPALVAAEQAAATTGANAFVATHQATLNSKAPKIFPEFIHATGHTAHPGFGKAALDDANLYVQTLKTAVAKGAPFQKNILPTRSQVTDATRRYMGTSGGLPMSRTPNPLGNVGPFATAVTQTTTKSLAALRESSKTVTAAGQTMARQTGPLWKQLGQSFKAVVKPAIQDFRSQKQSRGAATRKGVFNQSSIAGLRGGRINMVQGLPPRDFVTIARGVSQGMGNFLFDLKNIGKNFPAIKSEFAKQAPQIKTTFRQTMSALKTSGSVAAKDLARVWKESGAVVQLRTATRAVTTAYYDTRQVIGAAGQAVGNALNSVATKVQAAGSRIGGFFSGGVDPITGQTRGQRMAGMGNTAVMGLMGLSMAASFAGGAIGEMAQKIMPVTMGLMGLQMVLPMLKSPMGIAVIAIGALVGSFVYLRKRVDDAAKSAAKMASEQGAAANRMETIAEALNYEFAADRVSNREFRFSLDEETQSAFDNYFEGEAGSKFVADLKEATSEERFAKLSSQLAFAIADGLNPQKARDFGLAVAKELDDSMLASLLQGAFVRGEFKAGSGPMIDLIQERQQASTQLDITSADYRSQLDSRQRLAMAVAAPGTEAIHALTRPIADLAGTANTTTDVLGKAAATVGTFAGATALAGSAFFGVGAGPGLILGTIAGLGVAIPAAMDDMKALEQSTRSIAAAFGSTIQVLREMDNAEALLLEERRQGLITAEEYARKEAELNKIKNTQAEFLSTAIQELVEQGASEQAIVDQLVMGGFDEATAGAVARATNKDVVATQLFGVENYEALSDEQENFVNIAIADLFAGLTPENAQEKINDISTIYSNIAKNLSEATLGTMDLAGLQDLGESERIAQAAQTVFSDILGQDLIPEFGQDVADNFAYVEPILQDLGLNATEVFNQLIQFKDPTLAKNIALSGAELARFANNLKELSEFEQLDIELVTDLKLDSRKLAQSLERMASIRVDDEVSGILLNPEVYTNIGLELGKTVPQIESSYSALASQIDDAFLKAKKNSKDLNGEIKGVEDQLLLTSQGEFVINQKLVMDIFGATPENAGQVTDILNSAFPDGLDPITLQIAIQAVMDPTTRALIAANPDAFKAAMAGESTYEVSNLGVEERRFGVTERMVTKNLADEDPFFAALAQQVQLTQEYAKGQQEFNDAIEDTDPSGSGGAGKEKSALEELQESIAERTALYLGLTKAGKKLDAAKKGYFGRLLEETTTNNSIANQLRKLNISESLIADILAKGAESAQEIIDQLGPNGLKRLSKTDILSRAGELVDTKRTEVAREGYKATARQRLEETGKFTAEEIEEILQDEEATEIIALLPKRAKRVWNQLIKVLREGADATKEVKTESEKTLEAFEEQSSKFDQLADLMMQGFDAAEIEAADRVAQKFFEDNTELAEKLAESTGHTVENGYQLAEAMRRQISLNERLIDAEQDRVDQKQEEISDYERINDLIKQGIDTLKRQEEMRNRRSESLSRELEQIADAEEKIRESYQKRINELDKVAEVNDYIIQQQKQQIDLSQAISEGDIYAATQAAQEMRAASAERAVEQRRAALEQGMENAIAGLVSGEGMTRAQIEEEINNIKEQNYQTSLLIRAEEDRIYKNNLEIKRLSNEIYDIQENIIEPLQNQNDEYSRMLEYYKEDEDYQISRITLAGMTREQFEKQADALKLAIDNAKDLDPELKKLVGDYEAIERAARAAADQAARLGTTVAADQYAQDNPGATTGSYTPTDYSNMDPGLFAGMDFANLDLSGLDLGFGFAKGGKVMKYAMGGMVNPLRYTSNEPPPARRYAGGSIGGNGSRDSVPAMLTPGEFVIRKAMVDKYGIPMLKALNQGSFAMPRYNVGEDMMPEVEMTTNNMVSNINAPVYNSYDMKFSINGANQSADEIANTVMFKMRQLQNQGIRTNRGY